jgi:UPF0271 protein
MPAISSANIACGFHAGDPDTMERAVSLAAKHGVAIGAHTSFPDLAGFGRREMKLALGEIQNLVLYQVGALDAFVRAAKRRLTHVKPHGALYNMAAGDLQISLAIAEAVARLDDRLALVGLANSELISAAERLGLRAINEVFADRSYEPDGSLTPRSSPNALITDPAEAAARVLQMLRDGKVIARDGTPIAVRPETVCVHSDTPGAVEFSKAMRSAVENHGVAVLPATQD